MKKKILKIIILLILIILLIFVPTSIYKFVIIYKSDKAYHDLENCDTYKYTYTEETYNLNDERKLVNTYNTFSTMYYKDKILKTITKVEYPEDPEEETSDRVDYRYYTDGACIEIIETAKAFSVLENEYPFSKIQFINYQYLNLEPLKVSREHFFDDCYLKLNYIWNYIVTARIKEETFEDIECYRYDISSYLSYASFFINKENFLPVGYETFIQDENGNIVYRHKYTYDYELNCVTDEDVKLPDYRQYKQMIH